jgi:hypothetical protein
MDPQEINRRISALAEEIREAQGESDGWSRNPDAGVDGSFVHARLREAREKIAVLKLEHDRLIKMQEANLNA